MRVPGLRLKPPALRFAVVMRRVPVEVAYGATNLNPMSVPILAIDRSRFTEQHCNRRIDSAAYWYSVDAISEARAQSGGVRVGCEVCQFAYQFRSQNVVGIQTQNPFSRNV